MKMKNLYVFGNEFIKEDALAHEVANHFNTSAKVIHCSSPEFLLETKEQDLLILDVVENIKKPILIEDISELASRTILSLHDFDLGYILQLLDKLGKKKNIKIIGIPPAGNAEEIAEEVKKWI